MKVMFNWKTASVVLRSMEMEFMSALRQLEPDTPCRPFCDWHRLSGGSFYPGTGGQKQKSAVRLCRGTVYAVVNHYFGETIDVAGLVTATDLMTQLKGSRWESGCCSANMLRHGGDIFLDDYRVSDVERALGVPVRIAETDGFSLVDAIFELEY